MADLRRVYLDACCFIDMVKTEVGKNLDSDRKTDVWFMKQLLQANRDQEVEVYTSTLSIAECSHGGDGDVSEAVKIQFSRLLMSGQYVRLVQLTPFIAQDARDLRWKHDVALRGPDAVHVASAIAMECEEFISNNGRFRRVEAHLNTLTHLGLSVIAGRHTVCLPAKYRQLDLPDAQKPN